MMKLISHRGDHYHRCFLSMSGHSQNEAGSWEIGLGYNQSAATSIQQPLAYDGYYWGVFTGEISNRQELYQVLGNAGYRFRTNQDSEIILVSYLHWGLNAFDKIRGQWSVVITDLVQKRAVLARDRIGAKPLYFRHNDLGLFVASEIKQFRAFGAFSLNESNLFDWLARDTMNPGQTMFSDLRELLPGCVLTYSLVNFQVDSETPYMSKMKSIEGLEDTHARAEFFRNEVFRETSSRLGNKHAWGVVDDGSFASFVLHDCVSTASSGRFHSYCPVFAGHNTDMSEPLQHFVAHRGGQTNFFSPDNRSFNELYDQFVFAAETPVVNLRLFIHFLAAREMSRANFQSVFCSHGVERLLYGQWKAYCSALSKQLLGSDPILGITELVGSLLAGGNRDLFWQYNSSILPKLNLSSSVLSKEALSALRSKQGTETRVASDIRNAETMRLFSQSLMGLEKSVQAFGVELIHPFATESFVEGTRNLGFRDLYRNGWNQYVLRLGFGERLPASLAWNRRDSFRDEMLFDWFAQSIISMCEPLIAKRNANIWALFSHSRCQKLLKQAKSIRVNRAKSLKQLLQVFSVHRWHEVFELR